MTSLSEAPRIRVENCKNARSPFLCFLTVSNDDLHCVVGLHGAFFARRAIKKSALFCLSIQGGPRDTNLDADLRGGRMVIFRRGDAECAMRNAECGGSEKEAMSGKSKTASKKRHVVTEKRPPIG